MELREIQMGRAKQSGGGVAAGVPERHFPAQTEGLCRVFGMACPLVSLSFPLTTKIRTIARPFINIRYAV